MVENGRETLKYMVENGRENQNIWSRMVEKPKISDTCVCFVAKTHAPTVKKRPAGGCRTRAPRRQCDAHDAEGAHSDGFGGG